MKRRIILSVILAAVAVLLSAAGHLLVGYVTHPAFSHADYVYGDHMVIDNETPFEYDERLSVFHDSAGIGLVTYGDPVSNWERDRNRFGNKILREKDGWLYTVYSVGDNRLYYVFFEKDSCGRWVSYTSGFYDTVHSVEGLDKYVYEHDLPAAILGDAVPSNTISAEDALHKAGKFQNDLYAIRYNLQIDDLQEIMLQDEMAQAYRMTIDTMGYGVYLFEFHVYTDGTGSLSYKRYNSETGLTNKGLFDDVTYQLTSAETGTLLSVWTDADFFNLSPVHPYDTAFFMDGQHIFMEGMDDLWHVEDVGISFYNYHMIGLRDDSLIYPQFFSIHDALIALVESKGTEVRFNFRSEEEKLQKNIQ